MDTVFPQRFQPMPDITEAVRELRKLYKLEQVSAAALTDSQNGHGGPMREFYERQVRTCVEQITFTIRHLLNYPPQHLRHFPLLQQFHDVADESRSIFIMTKYPDNGDTTAEAERLQVVINAVRDAVEANGCIPRLASDRAFHAGLWDNVELYLLGCSKAIAIVEDRYRPELNPNVAMEWGWLRAMGKPVLYLVEASFGGRRADWSGLIESAFDWESPHGMIAPAVTKWLRDLGIR